MWLRKASYNFWHAFGRIIQTFLAFPIPDTTIHEPFIWVHSKAEVHGKASLTFIKLDLIRKSNSSFIHVKEDSGLSPQFITITMSVLGDAEEACSHLGNQS